MRKEPYSEMIYDAITGLMELHRFNVRDAKLLLEAYRRFHMFEIEKGRTLETAWLGYGIPEKYKSVFFESIGMQIPDENGNYKLSAKGVEVIGDLNVILPWNSGMNITIFEEKVL